MSTSVQSSARKEASPEEKPAPLLVLRGTRRNDAEAGYDTTVLLFQAEGANHLQGFVQANGQKRQVIAHINRRNPDPATGEVKPNFITLTELDPKTEQWEEIGHGNAVNRRSDNKPVHFDEVLFNVQGETLRARVARDVEDSLHRRLGFEQPRVARTKPADNPAPAGTSETAESRPAPARARTRS